MLAGYVCCTHQVWSDKIVTDKRKPKYQTKTYSSVIISNDNGTPTVLVLIFTIKCQRITICCLCRLFKICVNWRLCLALTLEAVGRNRLLPVKDVKFMSAWQNASQPWEVSISSTTDLRKLDPATGSVQAKPAVLTPYEVLEEAYSILSGNSLYPGESVDRHNWPCVTSLCQGRGSVMAGWGVEGEED